MNYEAALWTPVPFEYSPSIATLLALLSAYPSINDLSFDLRPFIVVKLALILTEFAPKNYQSSSVSRSTQHISILPWYLSLHQLAWTLGVPYYYQVDYIGFPMNTNSKELMSRQVEDSYRFILVTKFI